MKNPLSLVTFLARALCLTRNIHTVSCIVETDGKPDIRSRILHKRLEPFPCYSATKSTVALALGVLYDRGLIQTDDKVFDLLKEFFPENYDKNWEKVTISHLLHHLTGTANEEEFDGGPGDFDVGEKAWSAEDNLTAVFSVPFTNEPGKVFHYKDENYYVLARIVEKLAKKDVETFLAEHFFVPMGFKNYAMLHDPNGHVMGGTGMMLRTQDYAKLAWLWLHDGNYNGKQLVSEEWIRMGLTASVNRENNAHYGFGVRRLSENGYSITGACGQGAYFNRTKNFVVAFNARKRNQVMTLLEVLDKLNIL